MDDTADNRRYEYWLVAFYNTISCKPVKCFEEIPPEARELLAFMDYEYLIEPFLAKDLIGGASREIGPIRYGVTEGHARSIGYKYAAFPRKKNRLTATEETNTDLDNED